MMLAEYMFDGDFNHEGLPCGRGTASNDSELHVGIWLKNKEHGILLSYIRAD